MPTIAILLHDAHRPSPSSEYILLAISRVWSRLGIDVEVLRGIAASPTADLVMVQVDLTVLPPEYQEFTDQYPAVLNRRMVDTRKSVFSTLQLRRGEPWSGPVIVKTDRNYGGLPETWVPDRESHTAVATRRPCVARAAASLGRLRERWRRPRHPLADAVTLSPSAYPVFDSIADVPTEAFDNPHLVVERFLAERDDGQFCARSYTFLGEAGYAERRWAPDPIVKGGNMTRWEFIDVPPELRALRRQMGIDYGKLDYVEYEGKPVLLDINLTPTWIGAEREPWQDDLTERLADGVHSFLETAEAPCPLAASGSSTAF